VKIKMSIRIISILRSMKPFLRHGYVQKDSRLISGKKGFGGFGFVGNMVLVMVVLAILLYIIYYFFWDKLIQGSLTPLADNVTKSSQQSGDLIGGFIPK